jgi:methyl-accepting chemotaxis protein
MDRSLHEVAALTKRAEEATNHLTRQAEEGGAAAQKSMQGMLRVRSAMEQSAGVIREMGKRSEEIGGIVNTINIIAERTNMLSLNASIEAARAGDAGRGFAVVAEEIRNLADRSAQATSDIAAIIRSLQEVVREAITASGEGMRIADESGQLAEEGAAGLKKIMTGITQTAELVAQIADATEEQLTAGQQVVTAIDTTATQTKQVSNAVIEQAQASQQIVKSSVQMRKTAKEVSKAVNEQGRAAREIIKAAQSTSVAAKQVRKASNEQSAAAKQITVAVESMRRGALSTTRALSEQAVAGDQVSKEAVQLALQINEISKAMAEQAKSASEISGATQSMRIQSDQVTKAMREQARTAHEMTVAVSTVSQDALRIITTNRSHLDAADWIRGAVVELREITTRNADGVKATLTSTTGLADRARQLGEIMDSMVGGNGTENSSKTKRRRTRKPAADENA